MDVVGRKEEYKQGKFYLAEQFDFDKPGPGNYLSEMIAWDPVKQQKVWGIKEDLPFMGGALTTAGGLVFYGNEYGWFKAVDAKSGQELWKFNAGSGITQGAITYQLDGKQYIAVVSGRLKGPPSFFGKIGERVFAASPEGGALFVFELPSS
jgi:glucose dehydrogenase